jgi:hypothetical protein
MIAVVAVDKFLVVNAIKPTVEEAAREDSR